MKDHNEKETDPREKANNRQALGILDYLKTWKRTRRYETSIRFVLGSSMRELLAQDRGNERRMIDVGLDFPGLFPEIPAAEEVANTTIGTIASYASARIPAYRIATEAAIGAAHEEFKEAAEAFIKPAALLSEPHPTDGDRVIASSRKAEASSDYMKKAGSQGFYLASGTALVLAETCALASALFSRYEPPIAPATSIGVWVTSVFVEALLVFFAAYGVLPTMIYLCHIADYHHGNDVPPKLRFFNVVLCVLAFAVSWCVAQARGDSMRTGDMSDIALTILSVIGLPLFACGAAIAFRQAANMRDDVSAAFEVRRQALRNRNGLKAKEVNEQRRIGAKRSFVTRIELASKRIDIQREKTVSDILKDPIIRRQIRSAAEKIVEIERNPPEPLAYISQSARYDRNAPFIEGKWKER